MRIVSTTILASLFLSLLSACSDTAEEERKAQEKASQRATLEKKRQDREAVNEETISKGASLLSRSTIGEVTIEAYEIPRHRYVITGSKLGVTKDICVVYTKRGVEPLMDCYRTEGD